MCDSRKAVEYSSSEGFYKARSVQRLLGCTLLAVCMASWCGAQTAPGSVDQRVTQLENELKQTQGELRETREQLQQILAELRELRNGPHVTETSATQQKPANAPSGESNYIGAPEAPAQQAIIQTKPAATLDEIRDNQALIAQQVEEQHQTKVESASRYRVKVSGLVLMNTYANSGNVDVPDLPNRASSSTPKTGIGATFRQTVLGLQVFGPEIAGAQTSGSVSVDFFGGTPQTPYGTTAGVIRMREASARLDWKTNSLTFGQLAPFFSPLSPTTYATLAEPGLSWAGNLWVWTPQIMAEHRFVRSDDQWFSIQGGLLLPLTEEIPESTQYTGIDAGQRSRRPAIAADVAWNAKAFGQPLQLGAGAYNSHLKYDFGRETDAWAITAHWRAPLGPRVELSGEGYRGLAVGGLGGGIWQSVAYDGDPSLAATHFRALDGIGGWSQLKFRLHPKWEANTAIGQDEVFGSDSHWAPTLRNEFLGRLNGRNRLAFGNVIYHPKSNLLFGLEYRHIWTWPVGIARRTADNVNLAAGITF